MIFLLFRVELRFALDGDLHARILGQRVLELLERGSESSVSLHAHGLEARAAVPHLLHEARIAPRLRTPRCHRRR